ncbi:WD40 domain-containing protein/TFIIIC_delta domain-containing protein/zf-TFIIIC domain-containing protein [Cephalotus follicularis]|uniref:WD40 domain-containing protein/TFIIIC_delta domain-containing protein/zf-TFIIIC domain-containing protein n=1 Tax=Cephalotus follicularis TaxID=3775 RepID=A0A1Q3AZS3_CEPFO|nr:WD40 domain-containing protein/TFIIIC_delta domain-containing protein/zf-TFIIIC domain-containing protein [Cephalotus follicularis]
MASRFQAATLVAAPSFPNSITWSDENLIAVASGHLVTILNPAMPYGPRGLITVPASEPYPIGVIKRQDLFTDCLLPTSLSRDRRPCVRSISWSHIGMAPSFGCLLAVCTTDGRVKLYRPPFCDFRAEWVEVLDISDRLYDYLANIGFMEVDISMAQISDDRVTEHESFPRKDHKRRRVDASGNKSSKTSWDLLSCSRNHEDASVGYITGVEEQQGLPKVLEIDSDKVERHNSNQSASGPKSNVKSDKNTPVNGSQKSDCETPLITADQYASRSAMLLSLVVAWSPVLRVHSKICPDDGTSNRFSLLAVGGQSGKVSFWRIHVPQCYSIEHSGDPPSVVLVGLLEAHNSWITAISWSLFVSDSSNPQVLLATGGSDGSVRIWLGHSEKLLESFEVENAPFLLLKEVITVNIVPISVLSILVPVQSPHNMLLAVGKGSGSLEVWICDMSCRQFDRAEAYDAHDQVVTGLAWAFDGRCLYSCSQDNFVRSWILRGSSICEVALPSNTLGLRSSTDLPDIFVSSLGVAVSPGNLVMAMVRCYDADALDPMYQSRAQKAAVEFLWMGGQQLDNLSNTSQEFSIKAFPGFSAKELLYWESNILWSLKQYEHLDKPLVTWDIIAALLAFKNFIPKYVEHMLVKWISILHMGSHVGLSTEKVLSNFFRSLSKVTSRQLHLLNSICRCVMLSELKADDINRNELNIGGSYATEEKQITLWMNLLLKSERELRERLVCFSFSAFMSLISRSDSTFSRPGCWYPIGLAQMEQWVAHNLDHVQDQLKVLISEVGTHDKRIHSSVYLAEEKCSFCSATVPFDSPEVAFCQESNNGDGQSHKLERCAVSMQVCPAASLWFCKCCHRWISKLAPETLFTMTENLSDVKFSTDSPPLELSKPSCPLCGILLQRLQPEFLLSASPV